MSNSHISLAVKKTHKMKSQTELALSRMPHEIFAKNSLNYFGQTMNRKKYPLITFCFLFPIWQICLEILKLHKNLFKLATKICQQNLNAVELSFVCQKFLLICAFSIFCRHCKRD